VKILPLPELDVFGRLAHSTVVRERDKLEQVMILILLLVE
jgi:hypothetical protein